MWNRRVDKSVVYKAVTIMVCAAALVLVVSFIISFLLPQCCLLYTSIVMYTIMALIIVGGLGFVVWKDIASYKSSKKLTLQSRVVLSMTALLILSGALFFWAYEWNNTMSGLSFGEKITAGFFQSVTCRTAGFNSIDQATLNPISKGISTRCV